MKTFNLDTLFKIAEWGGVAGNKDATPYDRLDAHLNIIENTTLIEAENYDPGAGGLSIREHVLENLQTLSSYAGKVSQDQDFEPLKDRFVGTANRLTRIHDIFSTAALKAEDVYRGLEQVDGIHRPEDHGI